MLVRVFTCQNVKLLEILFTGSDGMFEQPTSHRARSFHGSQFMIKKMAFFKFDFLFI